MAQPHAVVTGAGTGIGAAITGALLVAGYRVSLMGRRVDVLQSCAESLQAADAAQCIGCDVTSPDSVAQAFIQARAGFGEVDVLINNAGAAPTAPFHKLSYEQWQQVLDVNLNGVFLCTQAVLPAMRERKRGRVINIASTAGLVGYAYVSAYTAAKHAVVGLTRALALETAALGITVNAVCPGYTDTEIIRASIQNIQDKTGRSAEEAMAEFTKVNPQQRLVKPEEVANTVIWLASPGSEAVTGQAISVSGGEVM